MKTVALFSVALALIACTPSSDPQPSPSVTPSPHLVQPAQHFACVPATVRSALRGEPVARVVRDQAVWVEMTTLSQAAGDWVKIGTMSGRTWTFGWVPAILLGAKRGCRPSAGARDDRAFVCRDDLEVHDIFSRSRVVLFEGEQVELVDLADLPDDAFRPVSSDPLIRAWSPGYETLGSVEPGAVGEPSCLDPTGTGTAPSLPPPPPPWAQPSPPRYLQVCVPDLDVMALPAAPGTPGQRRLGGVAGTEIWVEQLPDGVFDGVLVHSGRQRGWTPALDAHFEVVGRDPDTISLIACYGPTALYSAREWWDAPRLEDITPRSLVVMERHVAHGRTYYRVGGDPVLASGGWVEVPDALVWRNGRTAIVQMPQF